MEDQDNIIKQIQSNYNNTRSIFNTGLHIVKKSVRPYVRFIQLMWSMKPALNVWYFVDIGSLVHLDICTFLLCHFPGNATSWESSLTGKLDFLGKVTSREVLLPGKVDFPGCLPSREVPYKSDPY